MKTIRNVMFLSCVLAIYASTPAKAGWVPYDGWDCNAGPYPGDSDLTFSGDLCSVQLSRCRSYCDAGIRDYSCNEESQFHSGYCYCYSGSTPIMIDLDNNGQNYHITSATDGVLFDLAAAGIAKWTAWTAAGSNVAFLAIDRNGNGRIDDGGELFGTAAVMASGTMSANGFEALRDLDGGIASDGKIDASDPVYASLRLWFDLNHSGTSDPGELVPLAERSITTIFLSYTEGKRVDPFGNKYWLEGKVLKATVNGEEVARRIFDVLLRTIP